MTSDVRWALHSNFNNEKPFIIAKQLNSPWSGSVPLSLFKNSVGWVYSAETPSLVFCVTSWKYLEDERPNFTLIVSKWRRPAMIVVNAKCRQFYSNKQSFVLRLAINARQLRGALVSEMDIASEGKTDRIVNWYRNRNVKVDCWIVYKIPLFPAVLFMAFQFFFLNSEISSRFCHNAGLSILANCFRIIHVWWFTYLFFYL